MSNIPILNLPAAISITGTEQIPAVQNGTTVRIPASLIAGSGIAGVSQIVAGTNVTISPTSGVGVVTINATGGGGGGGVTQITAGPNIAVSPSGGTGNVTVGFDGILPVASGGTGTSTPALVAGTNVTITGDWPNQTINASGGGGGGGTPGGPTGSIQFNGGGGTFTGNSANSLYTPAGGAPTGGVKLGNSAIIPTNAITPSLDIFGYYGLTSTALNVQGYNNSTSLPDVIFSNPLSFVDRQSFTMLIEGGNSNYSISATSESLTPMFQIATSTGGVPAPALSIFSNNGAIRVGNATGTYALPSGSVNATGFYVNGNPIGGIVVPAGSFYASNSASATVSNPIFWDSVYFSQGGAGVNFADVGGPDGIYSINVSVPIIANGSSLSLSFEINGAGQPFGTVSIPTTVDGNSYTLNTSAIMKITGQTIRVILSVGSGSVTITNNPPAQVSIAGIYIF
jgi:hypothetical protein